MLVDNVFEKINFRPLLYSKPLEPEGITLKERRNMPQDCTIFISYLYSSNIKLPEKDYYVYNSKRTDSIRINKLEDFSKKSDDYCLAYMDFIEVNSDTTKIKIKAGYSYGDKSQKELTYTDTFDVQNCKWIVLDSTLWQY